MFGDVSGNKMLATRQLRDPVSKLVVRAASSSYEAYEAIAFRSQTFGRMASPPAHSDGDQFDGEFEHILIQDSQTGIWSAWLGSVPIETP